MRDISVCQGLIIQNPTRDRPEYNLTHGSFLAFDAVNNTNIPSSSLLKTLITIL